MVVFDFICILSACYRGGGGGGGDKTIATSRPKGGKEVKGTGSGEKKDGEYKTFIAYFKKFFLFES